MIGQVCDVLANTYNLNGSVAARSSIGPFIEPGAKHFEWNRQVLNFVQERQIKDVLLAARWEYHFSVANFESNIAALRRKVESLIDNDVTVWIMEQVPLQRCNPNPDLARCAFFGKDFPTGIALEDHHSVQMRASNVFGELEKLGAKIIRISGFCFDKNGRSLLCDQEGPYYWDDNHLSTHGANVLLLPALTPIFKSIAHKHNTTQDMRSSQQINESAAISQTTISSTKIHR